MTAPRPAHRTRAASAGLLALLVAVLALLVPGHAAAQAGDGPVVLLGVGGLRWSDVDPVRTPALWSLADAASLGDLSVRTVRPVTCPADGWLTVGAGRRAELAAPDATGPRCALSPVVTATAEGGARVPGWADVLSHQDELPYDAHPGLLADALSGRCATAVGPLAALALAGADGTVRRWRPEAGGLDAAAWSACDVWLVDLGTVTDPGSALGIPSRLLSRQEQVAALDARVAALLQTLPADADVLLAGLSDSSAAPHLTALAERRPGAAPGLMGSDSTRQPGLAQLTDLTPTLLARVGAPAPDELVGSPLTADPGRGSTAHAVARLADLDRAGQGLRAVTALTYLLAVAALLGVAARFALALRGEPTPRHWRTTAVLALAVAALPAAAFLAGTVPWWRAAPPLLALVPLLLLWAAVLALVALAGPWRRRAAGPATAVAVVTVLVLALDVATGARLALLSPLGFSLLEAGRFYGVGNVAFGLLITCGLLAVGVLVGPLLRAGRRAPAAALAAVLGVGLLAVDGAPGLGADVGGLLAGVPALVLLVLGLLGVRLGWRPLLAALVTGVVVVAALGLVDHARGPGAETHLGRFVGQVLDGSAGPVLARKLGANLAVLGSWGAVAAGVVLLALVLLLALVPGLRAPSRGLVTSAWAALRGLLADEPGLGPALLAAAVALLLGGALNDSGIVVPATGLLVGVPLLLAACSARAARRQAAAAGAPAAGRAGAGPARSTA